MIPKVSKCTVDILSQILYDKTQDVGMNYVVKGSDSPVLSDTWEETYELNISCLVLVKSGYFESCVF